MNTRSSVLVLAVLAAPALAQQPWDVAAVSAAPATAPAPAGTQGFPNFIGFMSNPPQNVDPRALTQVWPMFGSTWVSGTRALPNSDFQVYGAGLNLALSERLSIGFNNGGYATAHFSRDPARVAALTGLRSRLGLPPRAPEGPREGFLDVGGFIQYTAVADVENQFLMAAGLNFVVPCGSYELFQGKGPVHLAPYLTVGKEFGNFHILATTGYKFPAGGGPDVSEVYYLNAHLDYQLCGWIYPLVEVNWSRSTKTIEADLQTRRGFISLGNFETTSDTVALSAGFNLVLVRDKLEIGAIYSTPLSTENGLYFNGLLVKMLYRF